MYLDPFEWAQLEILVFGVTEPATLKLIERHVEKGDCIIDVGAHVGHHALHAARAAWPDGRVFAFDPQPYNADRICRNALQNGLTNVVTVCAAAGDKNGFVQLPTQSDRDRSRLSLHERGPGDQSTRVEVAMRRLDGFMDDNAIFAIKLLKVDVEGFELEVLQGLGSRIANCQNIVLEMLSATGSLRNRQVSALLRDAGFTLRDVSGASWQDGQPLTENNLWAARV